MRERRQRQRLYILGQGRRSQRPETLHQIASYWCRGLARPLARLEGGPGTDDHHPGRVVCGSASEQTT